MATLISLAPGTRAPSFELKVTPDQKLSLEECAGSSVVLAFYPADWSPVCGDELAVFNELMPEFDRLGAQDMSRLRAMIGPNDHVLGPPDAAATIVEYGDYECPFCGQAQPQVKRCSPSRGTGSDTRTGTSRSRRSTRTPSRLPRPPRQPARRVGFWEMHDLLFANQDALELPALLAYAEAIDLELEAFEGDLAEHRFLERIRSDFMGGVRSGVDGTPTFFVDGQRHEGAATTEGLVAAIEGAPAAYRF